MTRSAPDFELVRQRLAQVRKSRRLGLRAAAAESKVSAATLSRLESGVGTPDLDTLSKLVDWLELDRSAVFRAAQVEPLDTPHAVEVHLRADPKLDPRTAQALAEGFRIMYERFTSDESEDPVPKRPRRG